MRLRCPQCRAELTIVDSAQSLSTSCPSCGSQVNIGEATVSLRPVEQHSVAHFDLITPVGQGQFGVVWRAWDRKLNRQVAIKIPRWEELSGRDQDGFLREAEAAAKLEHPNIVRVYEVANDEGRHYIVSQFINGVTLDDVLKAETLNWQQKAALLAKVADAVHFAHERHVIHRDLKPKNILVDTACEPFVADFGLAKQEASDFTLTADGEVLGTPAYMSPEQARGESRNTDRRSDVFSLGVILYEMLTGGRPFLGPNMATMLWQIESTNPTAPRSHRSEIPRDLETICLKALEKTPQRRYQTAAEMANDLRRYLEGRPIMARRVSPIGRIWRWARRNRLAASLVIIATTSVTAAAIMALTGPRTARIIHKVLIRTEPAGARVSVFPRDLITGDPELNKGVHPKELTPCEASLEPGQYLVVAALPDNRFHEVFRTIPTRVGEMTSSFTHRRHDIENGKLTVPIIKIPPLDASKEMVLVEGTTKFEMGVLDSRTMPFREMKIEDFFVAPHEATNKEFQTYWPVRYETRVRARAQHQVDGFPVDSIMVDEAIEIAERAGRRLLTEAEFEFIATQRGTTLFPWGNIPVTISQGIESVDSTTADITTTPAGIRNLFSNAEEITSSYFSETPGQGNPTSSVPGHYYVVKDCVEARDRAIASHGVKQRKGLSLLSASPSIGFRTARSRFPKR